MNDDVLHVLALSMVPKVGPITSKALIRQFGSARKVFSLKKAKLMKLQGIGEILSESIHASDYLKMAEREMHFCQQQRIQIVPFTDERYPLRLRRCEDAPLVYFFKGAVIPEARHVVAVVGSRQATEYGRAVCRELIQELKPYDPLIVSGLAYGIDVTAHKEALKSGLNTIAVLGHGLDMLYPASHKSVAQDMLQQGGLLSEFHHGVRPDRENFPSRNRIIAGLSDAVIVVEAKKEGGALITAEIASSYNRDVIAVPGRMFDELSEGCLNLIHKNTAQMLISPDDLPKVLGWNQSSTRQVQRKLFIELSEDEQEVMKLLIEHEPSNLDYISSSLNWKPSQAAMVVLQMEMNGFLKMLPGKYYKIAH
jgi:DNA processing protein